MAAAYISHSETGCLAGCSASLSSGETAAFVSEHENMKCIEYETGFRWGVKSINPAKEVLPVYIPASSSREDVEASFDNLVASGLTVIYTVAGTPAICKSAHARGMCIIASPAEDDVRISCDMLVI